MAPKTSKPSAIHLRIVDALRRSSGGLTSGQIRQELEKEGLKAEDQTHLDRRKRDLKKWFIIRKTKATVIVDGKSRSVFLYKLLGEKENVIDEGQVSGKARAEVIHEARGRCQMCGRTVGKHGITLVVDHKKPRDWGGTNDRENLWAICEECNSGKKAYFSSLNADPEMMRNVTSHASVHVRIGELLKAVGIGKRTRSSLLAIVADQDDWQKRLRELRYPVIGWEIQTYLYKDAVGRKNADYILRSYKPWPDDPSAVIRAYERNRQRLRKA